MERSEHLKFCRICKNRRMSSQKGIICGLTGDIADFEGECPDFDLDAEHKEELEEIKAKKSTYVSYNIPKPLLRKWKTAVILIPLIYIGLNLLVHFWDEMWHGIEEILYTIIALLLIAQLTTATLFNKYPIGSTTFSVITTFIISFTFFFVWTRYNWYHGVIPIGLFLIYFYILSDLHMYKERTLA